MGKFPLILVLSGHKTTRDEICVSSWIGPHSSKLSPIIIIIVNCYSFDTNSIYSIDKVEIQKSQKKNKSITFFLANVEDIRWSTCHNPMKSRGGGEKNKKRKNTHTHTKEMMQRL